MTTAPKVFRLRDILTKEVSLVDRAANMRTFLLRKNEAGRAVEADGQGGFVTKDDDDGKKKDPQPSEPAGDPPAGDPPKPADAPKKDELSVSKAAYQGLCKTIEKLTALAKSVSPSDNVLSAAAIESKLADALKDVTFTSEETVSPLWEDGVWKCDAQTLQKALKKASVKLAEVADSLAVDTSDEPPPAEMRWRIVDVLDNLVEFTRFEVAQRALEKRDESSQFEAIVKGLHVVLGSELEADIAALKTDSYAAQLVETAADVVKALRQTIKQQAQRIAKLEATPGLSQRLSIDNHEAPKPKAVSWPRDINQKVYPPEEDLSFA